jgi:aldose 1-epimerase
MSTEIHLGGANFGCSIDVLRGARLSSLRVNGRERLLTYSHGMAATAWGAYPMVPYAGRVRRGRFSHAGKTHQLPLNFGNHAIHGTVFDVSWSTIDRSSTHAVMTARLGLRWPFGGVVTHEVSVDGVERSVTCTLTVSTSDQSMPAQVGWHPWFVRPARLDVDFAEMYVRDADYIPDGRRVAPTPGPWDDCFVGPRRTPTVCFDDGATVAVESDCDHWVVYDMPAHALCVEPQSGPPDGFTLAPHVITPSAPLRRTMKLIAR